MASGKKRELEYVQTLVEGMELDPKEDLLGLLKDHIGRLYFNKRMYQLAVLTSVLMPLAIAVVQAVCAWLGKQELAAVLTTLIALGGSAVFAYNSQKKHKETWLRHRAQTDRLKAECIEYKQGVGRYAEAELEEKKKESCFWEQVSLMMKENTGRFLENAEKLKDPADAAGPEN